LVGKSRKSGQAFTSVYYLRHLPRGGTRKPERLRNFGSEFLENCGGWGRLGIADWGKAEGGTFRPAACSRDGKSPHPARIVQFGLKMNRKK
jgi:hypothetical protein